MAIPKMATVTELRQNLAKFLEELESGPLMVIQHSRAVGYLVAAEDADRSVGGGGGGEDFRSLFSFPRRSMGTRKYA